MKTAIILTGAMRSFDRCYANLNWMVFRYFPEAKIFVVTHDDEDAHKTALISGRAEAIRILKQPPMEIPSGCPSEWRPGQSYMHEPYHISVDPRAVLGQLWILQEGWKLYSDSGFDADLVIRCRPDLWFHSFDIPSWMGRFSTDPALAVLPWWGRFGGCNDRFALLGKEAASHYFKTYGKVQELINSGAPLHPETLVHSSMRAGGAYIDDKLRAEFSTLRTNGEIRPPEISAIDIAHMAC